jgi:hypothetical protein
MTPRHFFAAVNLAPGKVSTSNIQIIAMEYAHYSVTFTEGNVSTCSSYWNPPLNVRRSGLADGDR